MDIGFVIGSHLGPFNRFFCDWGPIQVLQWPQASASALHEGAYKSTDLQRRKKLQLLETHIKSESRVCFKKKGQIFTMNF